MTGSATVPTNLDIDGPEDLEDFVKQLLDNMQTRFNRLSDTILERVDTMGNKIDQLEKSINELIDEAVETPNNGATKAGVGQKKMGEHPDTADF